MKFDPQKYNIEDASMKSFIDDNELWEYINNSVSSVDDVFRIVQKSLNKKRLSLKEVATLIAAKDSKSLEIIKEGARELKKKIYGNRIVLFAPLYVGNLCSNNCEYCGFRASNKDAVRKTLSEKELIENVEALEENGHKRLILVYGEHKKYSPEYIADTIRTVYSVRKEKGEIRRVNINAAPLSIEGFRTVKKAGVGTYQVFQETYHRETYAKYHTAGMKADYDYRLTSLDRAQEAELDDIGIGVLFGLYDWRFEVMALLRHVNHLEACFNIGPHTISFPRLQKALNTNIGDKYIVSDKDFKRIIAILRLAVPYTGLILTAREPENIRNEVLQYGCSQIDAGTKIEIGTYATKEIVEQSLDKEQFFINDDRSLGKVMDELISKKYLPSFCTACYRLGRTGEHFMEFSVPGFIKRYCTRNAILTLSEYLEDYATAEIKTAGWELIKEELKKLGPNEKSETEERLRLVKSGQRDFYF